MKKKIFGWILFLFAVFVGRLIIFNLTYDYGPYAGGINWYIGGAWIVAGLLCLFGWYKLALRREE